MRHTTRATALIAAAILVAACGPGAAGTTAPSSAGAASSASTASSLAYLDEMCGGSQSSPCKAGTYQTRQFQPVSGTP